MTLTKNERDLILTLYELALSATDIEIFDEISEQIALFYKAEAASIWIKHPKVADAETRLGYFQVNTAGKLGLIDYQVLSQIISVESSSSGEVKDDTGKLWRYQSQPFQKEGVTGCLLIWYQNEFSELAPTVEQFSLLAQKLCLLIEHFLMCNRFDCKRFMNELNLAEKIQQSLIPATAPETPGISIGFRSIMANQVGGDYLDLITLSNNRLGIVVGDAMGKGIPGAFIMVMTRAIFRLLARANVGPEVLMRQINLCLSPELVLQNMFVSLFYGIYDPYDKTFQYSVAGHNPPVLLRQKQQGSETLPGKGLIIGGILSANYQTYRTSMNEGDILVVYSDGLKEARNKAEEQFGIERIGRTIRNYAQYTAEGISDCLMHSLMRHCDNQPGDDVSFIVLKVE